MDHSRNTLTAAVKSLADGVFPAVDPADPLATQQLSLVMDYLQFLRSRLPYLHLRAWIELRSARDLVETVRPHAEGPDPEVFAAANEELALAANVVLERTSVDEVERRTAALLAVVREFVRSLADGPRDTRRVVERAVFDYDERLSMLYRAWYVPLGFDPYPDEVPELSDVLAGWES